MNTNPSPIPPTCVVSFTDADADADAVVVVDVDVDVVVVVGSGVGSPSGTLTFAGGDGVAAGGFAAGALVPYGTTSLGDVGHGTGSRFSSAHAARAAAR